MASKDYYDRYWTGDGFNPTGLGLPRELEPVLSGRLSIGTRVLDIGCGDGAKVLPLVEASGIAYTGVDISETAVAAARSSGLNAMPILDVYDLPFGDETFDVSWTFEVLEHLEFPLDAVREIYRVTKPGGVLIASVPNVVEIRRRLEFLFGRWNPYGDHNSIAEPWRDPHIRFFTRDAFGAMVSRAGFDEVELGHHFDRRDKHRSLQRRIMLSAPYQQAARLLPGLLATRVHVDAVKPVAVRHGDERDRI